MMWLEVSRGMCLAWAAAKENLMLRHLLKVVETVYQAQLLCHSGPHLLLLLCSWLAPAGPLTEASMFVGASHPPACASLVQSLRAYLCVAIVFWLEALPQDRDTGSSKDERSACDTLEGSCSGGGEASCDGSDRRWVEVCRILVGLVDDIVNADTVSYFKTDVQMKKLTASLASSLASGSVSGGRGTSPGRVSPEVTQVDLDGGGARASLQVLVPGELGVVEKQSAAVRVEAVDPEVQWEADAVFSELENLKRSKESFEADRVSVPNPYFVWFKLKSVCELVVGKHDRQAADSLQSHLMHLRSSYLD